MSSRIRFNDAGDVYEAFPNLARFAPKPTEPADPLAYGRKLNGVIPASAGIAYVAHLLPRREAVWWGCQCVSAVLGAASQDEGFRLAAQWVREPDDARRREALAYAEGHPLDNPTTWLARAAGHSGGSLAAPDQPAVPPPPDACAQSVNAALVLSATRAQPLLIVPWIRTFAESGLRFGAGEEAKITPPSPPSRSPQAQESPQ